MIRTVLLLAPLTVAGVARAEPPLTEAAAVERALARHPAVTAGALQVDAAVAGVDRAG